jgi:hypothetical protein
MPALIRFLIRHALIGFSIGIAFTGVLLVLDIGSIRSLTSGTLEGGAVRILLTLFIGSSFASAQVGIAVMRPPSRRDDPMAPPDGEDGSL